ncbi:hypothetical protein [Streptomyces sp. NPDC020298]|uniref:hypothetical protein n=1 Tax=unclassified Streptomyces TaxID=2593676 RepID=UPI0033D73295
MAWFKIDDGFHCHPKVFAAGTPAVGLYVRCGSWAAQQVTDGVIPKHVARMYGTPRMIKALVDAGLWHQRGHACGSCPEADANSYVIHQYLEKNPSRAETDAARKAKSARQQRWREGKRGERDADVDASTADAPESNPEVKSREVEADSEGNSHRVEVEFASSSHPDHTHGDDLETGKPHVKDGTRSNVDADVDASPGRHGDAAPDPTRPVPTTPPPSTKEEGQLASSDATLPRIGDRPRIPDACRPLVDALTTAHFVVGWDLQPGEWFLIEALIKRCGIPALVTSARGSWQGARKQPRSGNYFLPAWRALPDAPAAQPQPGHLPVAVGADIVPFQPPRQIPTTDQRVSDAFNLAARLEAEERNSP